MSTGQVYIIGMGEVGRRIAAAFEASGRDVVPVTRSQGWPLAESKAPGLRIVCVREDDLPGALERLTSRDPAELVTVQNGWTRDLVPDGSTRGLIWFTSKGEFFRPLRPSPFSGPAAEVLARALSAVGIPADSVDQESFDPLDADKMGFNCVVGLPLAVHGVSLGAYLSDFASEAERVFTEAIEVCCRAVGCDPPEGAWPAFVASVEPLSWVTASRAKALGWRNGAVVRLASLHGLQAPANRALMAAHEARAES